MEIRSIVSLTRTNQYNTSIECPLAKIVWRIVHLSFSLSPPKNITNLFGAWLRGIPKSDLIQIRVGVWAILWAM